jgi:hypothetical protein
MVGIMEQMPERLNVLTKEQLDNAQSLELIRLLCHLKTAEDDGPRSLSDELALMHAAERTLARNPRTLSRDLLQRRSQFMQKSEPGTTTGVSWAAPLASIRPLIESFVDVARPQSLVGKLLPLASRCPFNVSVPTASTGGTYRWTSEGGPKPVGAMSLTSATLPIAKASGIIVISTELAKLTAPGSEVVVRRELIKGMSAYLDAQLTDPAAAAVGGTSPASITANAPSIGASGTTAAAAATDIKKLFETFLATNPDASSLVLLMSPGQATALAVATNSTTLGPDGGRLFGVPVLTGAIGSRIVLLDPTNLLIADDSSLDITMSTQGTVELNSTATSPVTAAAIILSLWQAGLTAFRIDRFISWKMARASAVLFTNTSYI